MNIRDVMTEQEISAVEGEIGPLFEFVYKKKGPRSRKIVGMRFIDGWQEQHRQMVDQRIAGMSRLRYRTEFAVFESREMEMSDQPKQPEDKPKEVEKDKPLDQKVKEVDHPPAGPPTVVVPPG